MGLLAPHEAPNQPRLRAGLHRGAQRLQEGEGGRCGAVLTEGWRHFEPGVEGPAVRLELSRAENCAFELEQREL